jgi:superfamily I DNA/RNA helicase
MNALNPRQREAVLHQDGPLLVFAGAGAGKTKVITERIARLVREGVAPENILGVTFTNKAAREMRERVAARLGRRAGLERLILSTFHSLALRIIRRDPEAAGYRPGFAVCDQGEQIAIVRKAASTVRGGAAFKPDDALFRIGKLKSAGSSPRDFERRATEEDEIAMAAIYRRYQDALRRRNALDFDDLLGTALALLRIDGGPGDYWRERFRYIMADEFQDTNAVQFEFVKELALPRDNIAVVGDDDQSIYAWRGALAGSILKFTNVYPSAKTVTLDQNYRSTGHILAAANAVVKNNLSRREKNLWSTLGPGSPVRVEIHGDRHAEAEAIAREIVAAVRDGRPEKRKWADHAVLIRAMSQARPLEDAFLAARIPYEVVGGRSLYDRKEARDVLSFLGAAADPNADHHLLRIVNVPPRGIGGRTFDALANEAARRGWSLYRALSEAGSIEGVAPARAEACAAFARQVAGWHRRLSDRGLDGFVDHILEDSKYEEEVRRLYANPLEAASRWNRAREVADALAAFERQNDGEKTVDTLTHFLQEAALVGKSESGDGHGQEVRIITVHSAKGLEFPHVFVPGLEDGVFPHKNSLADDNEDEERRLFYVAMTRARLGLTLSHSLERAGKGGNKPATPSRFLGELPDGHIVRRGQPARREEAREWLAQMRCNLERKQAK